MAGYEQNSRQSRRGEKTTRSGGGSRQGYPCRGAAQLAGHRCATSGRVLDSGDGDVRAVPFHLLIDPAAIRGRHGACLFPRSGCRPAATARSVAAAGDDRHSGAFHRHLRRAAGHPRSCARLADERFYRQVAQLRVASAGTHCQPGFGVAEGFHRRRCIGHPQQSRIPCCNRAPAF